MGPPTVRSHSAGSDDFSTSTPASPMRLKSGTGAHMPIITGNTTVRPFGAMRIMAPM